MTKAIDWRTNYRAVFGGSLTDKAAESWEVYAGENLDGLQHNEMNEAMAELCDTWPSDSRRNPLVRDVCKVIRERRLRARGFDTSKPFEVRQAEAILARTAEDGSLARWNVICGALDFKCGDGLRWAAHLELNAIANGGLTVPYWAATPARRRKCAVMDRETYVAGLEPEWRAIYERVAGMTPATIAARMDAGEVA